MQTVRLETKSREKIRDIELQTFPNGEPDVLKLGTRIFVRRPPFQTQPPKKNNPEIYFEAFTFSLPPSLEPAPAFDKVTETLPSSKTVK
jgi:hypothetical protein